MNWGSFVSFCLSSLMAALLGNHVLTEADLSSFHVRLIPKLDNKVRIIPYWDRNLRVPLQRFKGIHNALIQRESSCGLDCVYKM